MKRLEIGKVYIIERLEFGNAVLARVTQKKGLIFKRYKAMVWGVDNNGIHQWPNGSVSAFENWLTRADVKGAELNQ